MSYIQVQNLNRYREGLELRSPASFLSALITMLLELKHRILLQHLILVNHGFLTSYIFVIYVASVGMRTLASHWLGKYVAILHV